MPVRFKEVSEYKRNYRSRNSKKSDHFVSSHKKKSGWAGLPSYQQGITKEPSFISKKRVPYYCTPQISKSFYWEWDSEADKDVEPPLRSDVSLRQDVPKLIKTREASSDSQSAKQNIQTPNAPRNEKLPISQSANLRMQSPSQSPVKVNGKTAKVLKEDGILMPEKRNSRSTDRGLHRVLQKKAGLMYKPLKNLARSSEYDRQFVWKIPAENSPVLSAEQIFNKDSKNIPSYKSEAATWQTTYEREFRGSHPPTGPRLRKNLEGKEMPIYELENISPKQKAKIFNKDSKNVPSYKSEATTWQTTYEREFRGSPPPKGPLLRKNLEGKEMPIYEQENISPKQKAKRKKKEPLSLDVPVSEKQQEKEQSDENYILKPQNHCSSGSPTRRHRKFRTEYKSNFLSPADYKFKDGSCIKDYLDIWEEVKEVKEKAREYKRRALGTHFSRDHLNQIISENNRFWEESDSSTEEEEEDTSCTIKALDLARNLENKSPSPLKIKKPQSQTNAHLESLQTSHNKENMGLSNISTLPAKSKLAWGNNESSEDVEQSEELKQENDADRTLEIERAPDEKVEVKDKLGNASEDENMHSDLSDRSSPPVFSSERGGRLLTPKLKTAEGVQRTHHDRTTPVIGGAVLVSPPEHKSPSPEVQRLHLSPEGSSPLRNTKHGSSSNKSKKDDGNIAVQHSPSAGIKTHDPLPIREEWPASAKMLSSELKTAPLNLTVPKPKTTSQAQTSVHTSSLPFWRPVCHVQGSVRDAEFQHTNNVLGPKISLYRSSSSKERTSNDDGNVLGPKISLYRSSSSKERTSNGDEDERLSQISARSATSSSLASFVLERAEKRRNFWREN